LTLDDEGGLAVEDEAQDIFEETNFDVPALDDESGSESVALDDENTDVESSSDFEISLDSDMDSDDSSDSGSQVVALEDEEEVDEGAATVAKPRKPGKAVAVEDEEEVDDFDLGETGEAPAPKKKKKPAADEDLEVEAEEDEELVAAGPAVAADWGALPAVLLFPTVAVLFVVGIMGFEVMRGMWGYHRPSTVGKPVIDTIARQFDESLPK
jgi:hypothetical protein